MVKHRSHSAAFKHLVAQEYLAGDSVTELANRHGVSRHLVRIWVAKLEAGALDDDVRSAELIEPGFVTDVFSAFYPLAVASPAIRKLRLEEHGLRWRRAPASFRRPAPNSWCSHCQVP